MNTREWIMTEKSLLDEDVDSFEDLSPEEKENLKLVMTELKGWATQSVDMVLSVMAEDGVYYDITGEPAAGHDEIREFGIGWVDAVPDFEPFIEAFVVQGNKVVNMGRISGTMTKEFFGMPATGKKFDCQYCQVAFIEKGKIKYVRDHWNLVDMYHQVGWDCATLNK
ncbi:MAG: ester cyclase [Desulfatiglandaceae bacterium]